MQVAAGLGEMPEEAILTPTKTKPTAEGQRSRVSAKDPENNKFRKLFQEMARKEQNAEKERPVGKDDWAQLMLLFPQLSPMYTEGEEVSQESAELLTTVQESGDHLPVGLETETVPAEGEAVETVEPTENFAEKLTDFQGFVDTTGNTQQQSAAALEGSDPLAAAIEGVEAAETTSKEGNAELQTELEGLEVNGKGSILAHPDAINQLQPEFTADEGSGFEFADPPQEAVSQKATGTEEPTGDADALKMAVETLESEFRGETAKTREHKSAETVLEPVFIPEGPSPVDKKVEVKTVPTEPYTPQITKEELAAQIVNGAKLMVKNGVTKVQIQLEPAELGKLELSLVIERDLVAARFVTETQGVQSLIESNLPQLRSSLEEAGMQVDLLQVGVQNGTDQGMQQNQTTAGGHQFKRNSGWTPSAEMFITEEQIFGEEAWHGMVDLRL